MRTTYLLCIVVLSVNVNAQFYDNHWLLGYLGGNQTPLDDSLGVSILSFHEGDLTIQNNQSINLNFDGSSSAFSDHNGKLLFYSNNIEIRDSNDQQIAGGFFENNSTPHTNLPQSFVCIPFESQQMVQYIQSDYSDDFPRLGQFVSSSFIDLNEPIGIYNTLENILNDSLATGDLTACKHANGRDWWVLISAANKPLVYALLFGPNGPYLIDSSAVNFHQKSGLGQAVFSPDGNYFIRYNNSLIGEPNVLDIFRFNRCTGQISNHIQTYIESSGSSNGIAVSESSQYLYVSDYDFIYQYDLWANDIFASKDTVAIYDGYLQLGLFNSRFYLAQLAPDGKIYVNSPSGISKLTVIEAPDRAGVACNVRQHAIDLPNFNSTTLANHPNYRLGPIDGSPCDTLGIDNLPRAYYRIDRNTSDSLHFHFQDLSFYEPETWSWSFGDGGMSIERHPDHTYQSPGVYEVCLTVGNSLGMDTKCRTLDLGLVSVDDPRELEFELFPNPVQDVLVFDLGEYLPLNGRFVLYDAIGREVFSEQVLYRQARFDLSELGPGIYYYSFWDEGRKIGQGKVVVK